MAEMIHLKIKRKDSPEGNHYWEEFKVPYRKNMNVVACLMYIQKYPINASGEETVPVAFEANCLEEVCGSCTMIINGRARQSCSALIDTLKQPIVLEPMTKFPVVKDLVVDRKELFEALKRIKAWIELDGMHDAGPGPKRSRKAQEKRYDISRCMTCGICAEVCPNYNADTQFIGAHAIAQANLFNLHDYGTNQKDERLDLLKEKGGIFECGNSQNCVRSCPKSIELTTSIAEIKKEVTWHAVKNMFKK